VPTLRDFCPASVRSRHSRQLDHVCAMSLTPIATVERTSSIGALECALIVDSFRPSSTLTLLPKLRAAVAALGRPRGQAPLLDLFFGDGKPLEPEGQALGCSVCEHASRRRWSRDPEVQN
jgi:hypothetical protein